MRILIIEDEKKTATFIQRGLMEHGFAASTVEDGEEGLDVALGNHFDALVVDVMLPRRDGWSVVRSLREQQINTPVLYLTARDSVADRVKGLELGGDDYMVKPFSFSEMLARLRSLLRRAPAPMKERAIAWATWI